MGYTPIWFVVSLPDIQVHIIGVPSPESEPPPPPQEAKIKRAKREITRKIVERFITNPQREWLILGKDRPLWE
jgi:hypothetical protein